VVVKLLDVIDNSPAFNPAQIAFNFSESVPLLTKQSLGSVTDPDLGINTTQSIVILSGNVGNAFALQRKDSGDFDKVLDLVVNSHLDYEEVQSYTLVIRATDGGGRTGDMTVRINILDQNDNQPIFNTSKYDVTVAENATVDTSIMQVEATDRDSGDNGRVTYSIDPITDPVGHFRIDRVSGVVYVNKPLDYETQPSYRLTLQATDGGADHLTGIAALDIKLININEQPATIRLVFLQGAGSEDHIAENTAAGTAVARISIADPDLTENRQMDVNVTLLGGDNVFGLQISAEVLSLVVVNTPPDREVKAVYDLTVVVTDTGSPPLSASKSFRIYIDDVNDNVPRFASDTYYAAVNETAEAGTSVLRVVAVDTDAGDNARIHYSISTTSSSSSSSPQADWFQIDSNTGVITTRSAIDCEVNPQPSLLVVARDNGEPPLSGSTTVYINVRDVNDKQPEFETSFYSATVNEDFPVGQCLDIQVRTNQ
jgi:protocadherin-16/23